MDKIFYLTFDGAVDPPHTLDILEQLERYDIRATFFVEGHRIAGHEQTLREMIATGHHLGNHSFTHPDFSTLSLPQCQEEIRRCDEALYQATGLRTKLLRPPCGILLPEQRKCFEDMGYKISLWSISVKDWLGPDADAVVQRTIDLAREEQVVAVYHDFMETTAETVKKIVPQLLDKGYRFEPVPYPPETAKNL